MEKENAFIPYGKQSISQEDVAAVTAALEGEIITRGSHLEQFEAAIAGYCGATYAVAFNSGSSALAAACFAGGVNRHDRLVTTPNSFIATIANGMRCGAEPLFIDIDLKSGNIDLEQLQYNVDFASTRGRNVYLPVHFSGIPVDMERLESMVSDPRALIIEDAAHALGSSYSDGSKVGSCKWSQMTTFSFHPVKNITAAEGGMVTTHDRALYERLCLYRNNGIVRDGAELQGMAAPWYYEVRELGGNFFMNELQAALGMSQLKRIDTFAARRREIVAEYRRQLMGIPHLRLLEPEVDDALLMYHLFVVLIDFEACGTDRTALMAALRARGIGSQLHYIPLYHHPLFKGRDLSPYFPAMEEYYAQALSLPLYYDLSDAALATVIQALQEVMTAEVR